MIHYIIEINNRFYVIDDKKRILNSSDNLYDIKSNPFGLNIGSGIKKEIEKELEIYKDENLKLLRNQNFKSQESHYQVFSTGCIECDLFVFAYDKEQDYKYLYLFIDLKTRQIFGFASIHKRGEDTIRALSSARKFYKDDFKIFYFDPGSEFKSFLVKNWFENFNKTYKKKCKIIYGATNRRFNGVIEAYGGFIKKFVNEKLSVESLKAKKYVLNWASIAQKIIKLINKNNAKIYPKPFDFNYSFQGNFDNLLKVGDRVHVMLDISKGL
jgi:hypothetical protein